MASELIFEPKARMILQLGDQLIRNESIALLELVKNAYDANANSVTVSMSKLETPDLSEILIEDDGDGMNADIIKNAWMQPGSNYKGKLIESGVSFKDTNVSNQEDDKRPRYPIGGKGIGRFGVHKLGQVIELVSKKDGHKEVVLKIDWRDFEADKPLSKTPISFTENDKPQHFEEGKTGTRILVKQLKNTWTRGTVRDLYRSMNSLNSPFQSVEGAFKTNFILDDQSWLQGLAKFEDIKKAALYYVEATIENEQIKTLEYEFRPWDTMDKLKPRSEELTNVKMVENEKKKKTEQVPIDLSSHQIGPIKFKLLIFDRSSKILSLGLSDKKGFQDYLNQNGGVRVYRDNIRIYDYGEPDNDWLKLDLMRVNQPGKTISNNIIIGAVNLEATESQGLQEKTNREGFIENEAYSKFFSAIRFTLDKTLTLRNKDKEQIRKHYGTTSVSEPVVGHLQTLQTQISEKVTDETVKNELLKSITEIKKDYKTINEIYTRSASAGLSLSIVIHELIHMITELSAAIEAKPVDAHIKSLVKSIHKTVGDYADVIKQSKKKKVDLKKITRQSLSNIQFRFRAHEIEVINAYETRNSIETKISCADNLVISTIINILDNAIWWQIYSEVKNRKIYIDIVEYPEKHISLLIADNGPGFSISTSDAVKPFFSDKAGGMGLGLHLADEVMKGQKGSLLFPDPYDFEMPEEFQKGGKLLLAFRRML